MWFGDPAPKEEKRWSSRQGFPMVGLLSDYLQPFIQASVYMSVYVEFLAVELRALLTTPVL